MCEQAAEAHKSKGVGHSSRRGRVVSDSGQIGKSSVDALLSTSISALSSQVCYHSNQHMPSAVVFNV